MARHPNETDASPGGSDASSGRAGGPASDHRSPPSDVAPAPGLDRRCDDRAADETSAPVPAGPPASLARGRDAAFVGNAGGISVRSVRDAPAGRPTAAETNLYSEGAEFLVMGQLLIRGVHATKAYTRYPGWDVLAADPESGRSVRIQVKARLATDFDGGFPIKNLDAEFVVLVALNRGYRYAKAKRKKRDADDIGEREPEFFIFPMDVIRAACTTAPTWGTSWKIYVRRVIPGWETYRNAWEPIRIALDGNEDGSVDLQ